jgi:hypothetical protein
MTTRRSRRSCSEGASPDGGAAWLCLRRPRILQVPSEPCLRRSARARRTARSGGEQQSHDRRSGAARVLPLRLSPSRRQPRPSFLATALSATLRIDTLSLGRLALTPTQPVGPAGCGPQWAEPPPDWVRRLRLVSEIETAERRPRDVGWRYRRSRADVWPTVSSSETAPLAPARWRSDQRWTARMPAARALSRHSRRDSRPAARTMTCPLRLTIAQPRSSGTKRAC